MAKDIFTVFYTDQQGHDINFACTESDGTFRLYWNDGFNIVSTRDWAFDNLESAVAMVNMLSEHNGFKAQTEFIGMGNGYFSNGSICKTIRHGVTKTGFTAQLVAVFNWGEGGLFECSCLISILGDTVSYEEPREGYRDALNGFNELVAA